MTDKEKIKQMYQDGCSYVEMMAATGKRYHQVCRVVADMLKTKEIIKRDMNRKRGAYRKGSVYADKSWERTPLDNAIIALKSAGRYREKAGIHYVDGVAVTGNVTRQMCEMAGIELKRSDAQWI